MDKAKVLEVINSLEVFEQEGGHSPYILVRKSFKNLRRLEEVGLSEETIDKYGDGETFCILSLSYSEGIANAYRNGKLINAPKEIELSLPNDYVIQIFEHEETKLIGLVNPNGYIISDRPLKQTEIHRIRNIFS